MFRSAARSGRPDSAGRRGPGRQRLQWQQQQPLGGGLPLSARGGVESQLASNGSTVFAAVNNLGVPLTIKGVAESSKAFEASIPKATGEMIAVNQDTGKIEWDDQLPSTPYGAATITSNVVFTTTYSGHLYAFNAATGAILPVSWQAGAGAPTLDGRADAGAAAIRRRKVRR